MPPMPEGRRILVTGLSTYWGGRLAETLERNPAVETIIGVDSEDPTRELERTEFVRVSNQHALIAVSACATTSAERTLLNGKSPS